MLTPIFLLQDNARDLLDEDHLGMKPWVDVIAGSALGNDGPFTIGIYKEWGYGKTTLLQLAKQAVADYTKDNEDPVVTVWFNAWQFEREEHPLFPLIAAITDAIDKKIDDKQDSKLKSIGLSLRALTRGMKFKGEVQVPLISKVGVEFDADKALTAEELLGRQTNPLQAELLYHSAFELLGDATKGKDKAKIVVFIDDLDRCNPENAVRLLECIKLVLAQKGFVFVLAVDNLVIETYLDKVYEERYGFKAGTGRGRKYLEKIVQLPLEIPPHEKRFAAYVGKLIDELATKYNKDDIKIAALRTVQAVLAAHVGHNPRRLVRLVDAFLIDSFLWEGTADLRDDYKDLDVKVANGIAIHRVTSNTLGEELTSALIGDGELRRSLANEAFGKEREGVSDTDTPAAKASRARRPDERRSDEEAFGTAGRALTVREQLVQRLRQSPDLLGLLQSDAARALVTPGEPDLWAAVRHFMTTTRADAPVEFPEVIAKAIREVLQLSEDDPISSSRLAEVKSLYLSGMQVTDAGLAHLSGLSSLHILNLDGTQVGDAGLAHLSGLSSLQDLYLNATQVGDAGLAHLSGLASLHVLYLDCTQVGDAGLAQLSRLSSLKSFGLASTQVTDAGLAHLSRLLSLEWLDLTGTQVGDAGLAHLSGLSSLRALVLESTQVGDAGMAHLSGLSSLRFLYIGSTRVTPEGVAKLKMALPECRIYTG
jgi:hypothetical protein